MSIIMAQEEKLDWIYKSANSLVNREDYLLGRKVDKTLEQLNEEEKPHKFVLPTPKNHVEHECIPPSIRDFNKIVQSEQVDLSAKLQEDPLVAIKKREEEARRQFLQNPIQLKKLQEALKKKEELKKKKSKKSKKKHSDLDEKIKQKLQKLKGGTLGFESKKEAKKDKADALNTILMHKFNALKDKLSEDDLRDIINGKLSSDDDEDDDKPKKKKKKQKQTSSSEDESEPEKKQDRTDRRWRKRSPSRDRSINRRDRDKERSRYRSPNQSRNRNVPTRERPQHVDRRSKRSRSRSQEDRRKHYSSNRPYKTDSKRRSRSPIPDKPQPTKKADNSKKKKHSSSSDSDSSDGELDKKIMAQLKVLRGEVESKAPQKKMLPEKPPHLKKHSSSSSSDSSSEDDREKNKKYKYSDSEDDKPTTIKSFGLVTSEGKKINLSGSKTVPTKTVKKPEEVVVKPDRKKVKKLTEEEKEQLRKEMMKNAKVRDKEREETVRKYREKNREEEESVKKKFDADLVHAKLLKSAELGSVEQRIKSKLNNIQRSSRHMDQNFSKR